MSGIHGAVENARDLQAAALGNNAASLKTRNHVNEACIALMMRQEAIIGLATILPSKIYQL